VAKRPTFCIQFYAHACMLLAYVCKYVIGFEFFITWRQFRCQWLFTEPVQSTYCFSFFGFFASKSRYLLLYLRHFRVFIQIRFGLLWLKFFSLNIVSISWHKVYLVLFSLDKVINFTFLVFSIACVGSRFGTLFFFILPKAYIIIAVHSLMAYKIFHTQ
jgi:hypothetical protein